MLKIVECIPNFSSAQIQIVESLVQEAQSMPGVSLVDYSADSDHNRSVFTLLGPVEKILEVVFGLCKMAAEKIDMTKHLGAHPRMGATDVIPIVPVKGVTLEECVKYSKLLGEKIYRELEIPVFLYEESAQTEKRRSLEFIRQGQFEGMSEKLKQEEWQPDFGLREIHPTAGVVAVGVRKALIAFNVNLKTNDLKLAQDIAKAVRFSNGGFRYCKGIALRLEKRNQVQISMNLVDYERTPVYRVFETIRFEAKRRGVSIAGSELIGLTPAKALIDCAEYYLQLESLDFEKQILENHLLGM